MKKGITKLLAGIGATVLAMGILTGCQGKVDTEQPISSQASSSQPESSQAHSEEEVVTELSGALTLAGSTSMEKLANALKESFMEKYNDVTVSVEFTGSGAGIEAVLAGTTDIGNSSRNLKEEEKTNGAVENIVAIDGIAVVVDQKNTVASIT